MKRKNVLLMGAAGRDFHNFNVLFRDNPMYEVKAFTATQIPNIDGRKYPASLAGGLYPSGIPILSEENLLRYIRKMKIDSVYFSYSDVSNEYVMKKASEVLSAGAEFILVDPKRTMLKSKTCNVISVCAVRTGCGKSQTTRKVCKIIRDNWEYENVAVVRHPMPYGNLERQAVQKFATMADLDKHECTIEEREEYEPLIKMGVDLFAGVDYGSILKRIEEEDYTMIVWDGGNNDTPFYEPALHLVVLDPYRAGHELKYYPSSVNLRMADVAIVNKIDVNEKETIEGFIKITRNVEKINPAAEIIMAESEVKVNDPELIKGKSVVIVEDGPTVTHGGMNFGAGYKAARIYGAALLMDPIPHAVGSIKKVVKRYCVPAMGYGKEQIKELEETLNAIDCQSIIMATPADLRKVLKVNKPVARVTYEYKDYRGREEKSKTLEEAMRDRL